jgi:hypothetical protein
MVSGQEVHHVRTKNKREFAEERTLWKKNQVQCHSLTRTNQEYPLAQAMDEILLCDGGNKYKLPHMHKDKLIRQGALPVSITSKFHQQVHEPMPEPAGMEVLAGEHEGQFISCGVCQVAVEDDGYICVGCDDTVHLHCGELKNDGTIVCMFCNTLDSEALPLEVPEFYECVYGCDELPESFEQLALH